MGAMTIIAKMRPTSMKRVLQNFEILHLNLPTSYTKSQVRLEHDTVETMKASGG